MALEPGNGPHAAGSWTVGLPPSIGSDSELGARRRCCIPCETALPAVVPCAMSRADQCRADYGISSIAGARNGGRRAPADEHRELLEPSEALLVLPGVRA